MSDSDPKHPPLTLDRFNRLEESEKFALAYAVQKGLEHLDWEAKYNTKLKERWRSELGALNIRKYIDEGKEVYDLENRSSDS